MRQFGDLEAAIMDRLWERGSPALVREILDDLSKDRQLAYTTVMTVMENLYRKGDGCAVTGKAGSGGTSQQARVRVTRRR
jgi:predicted transcriptional regulator